jgi:predicted CXXCH cytochrome family protein
MKKRVFFLFLFATLVRLSFSNNTKEIHDFSGICDKCHLNDPIKGGKNIYTNDESDLCLQCHSKMSGLSHPVGVKPTMKIPKELPLDWKGEITCVTCHIAHHKKNGGDFFMRDLSKGELFCRKCHNEFPDLKKLHNGLSGTAHVGKRYREESKSDIVDELSMKCLNCHDATIGSNSIINSIGRGVFFHAPGRGSSHPIGMLYRGGGAYMPKELLDERLLLFDGKVGCGTCHNPYSKNHFKLVITEKQSSLCLACHRK